MKNIEVVQLYVFDVCEEVGMDSCVQLPCLFLGYKIFSISIAWANGVGSDWWRDLGNR